MNYTKSIVLLRMSALCALLASGLLGSFWQTTPVSAYAKAPTPTYHQVATIAIPGASASWCFDVGVSDPSSGLSYLADATNRRVDILNPSSRTLVGTLGQGSFTGSGGCTKGDFSHLGPAGLLIDQQHQLWASNGDSTISVFDIAKKKPRLVATISTGGKARTDEMTYDPSDNIVMVNNPDEKVPFSTFIDASSHSILGKMTFPQATNGLEQPVWDSLMGLFFLAIPAFSHSSGAIAMINPELRSPLWFWSTPHCAPTGLAVGPDGQAAVGCDNSSSLLMDLTSGEVQAHVTQASGVDIVAYDPSSQHYFFAQVGTPAGGSALVISDTNGRLIQSIPTQPLSHSVVVASMVKGGGGLILVPQRSQGVSIYSSHA